MNKFVNLLLLVLIIPIIAFTIFIGFDLPIEIIKISGANAPYKEIIFMGFAVLLFLILVNRSIKRWLGIKMVNQTKRFQWNVEISRERSKQVVLYLVLEASVQLFVAYALYKVSEFALPVSIVLIVFSIDHLILAFVGSILKKFRIGITSKAILVADRETKAVYFQGLKEVDVQQQSLFFDYINDLQLSISSECIPSNDRANFKSFLDKNIDRNRVYFSESLKAF
jgi:hypothetical protein